MKSSITRLVASAVIVTFVLGSLPFAPMAHAGMVQTADVFDDRARIHAVLDRDDVRAQLEQHGVSLADAKARVAALSDSEARQMADQLETMPAGAADVVGVLFTVFVILLVTDLLGLTSVFPFTRR